jgi:hypothetical protein
LRPVSEYSLIVQAADDPAVVLRYDVMLRDSRCFLSTAAIHR